MWIYRKTKISYQVGYLIFGFWFKVVETYKTVTVGDKPAKDEAVNRVSFLNGGL